jgi:hypothetical protein
MRIRYSIGARMLRQNIGFTVVAFLMHTLKFGANTPIAVDQRLKRVFRRVELRDNASAWGVAAHERRTFQWNICLGK